MKHRTIAAALATVLAVDGLIHLYWATGAVWPARDATELSRVVLNTDVPFVPQGLVPLAAVLAGGASVVLAQGGLLRLPVPATALRWGTRAVATGLSLRGLAGLVWATGLGADTGSLFYRLNLGLYTPLCLVGAVGAWRLAARH